MKKGSKILGSFKKRIEAYLKRRPHRSFRRTLRRDYKRSLELPGFVTFNRQVSGLLWKNRKTFVSLIIIYVLLTIIFVGIASQDLYSTIKDTLNSTSGDLFSGLFGEISKAGLLTFTGITGGFTSQLTDLQQIYASILFLMAWLTTVWLLRNILAGRRVKLRDGLYSAGAPILSTFLVSLLLVVQLLPIALALIGYSAAAATGLLDSGVEAMLFWIAAGLLTVLSIYFITGTIFAMIIVTLPGMYPYRAIKAAGDLVIGRRVRILIRLIWMLLSMVVIWGLVMIPVILFDSWVKSVLPGIGWMPIVPIVIVILSSLTVVWSSSYLYLLYRKVVDDESEPA